MVLMQILKLTTLISLDPTMPSTLMSRNAWKAKVKEKKERLNLSVLSIHKSHRMSPTLIAAARDVEVSSGIVVIPDESVAAKLVVKLAGAEGGLHGLSLVEGGELGRDRVLERDHRVIGSGSECL